MSILTTIVVFDAPIALVGCSEGATLYVNTTGSGGAYTSIQDAINAAGPGDTVFVYNGTFYENIDVNKDIHLKGESNLTTIIDGMDGDEVILVSAQWANITGFTVKNASRCIDMPNSNTIIENMIIDQGGFVGIFIGSFGNTPSPIIRNNTFRDCSSCIFVDYGATGVVEGNTIDTYTYGRGIYIDSGYLLIIRNTIETNGGNSQGISLGSSTSSADIIDNTIYSDATWGLYSCAVESQYGVGRIYNCSFDYPEELQEFTLGNDANLTVYNTNYDSVYYYSSTSGAIVNSYWWNDVYVRDTFDNPVSNAEVWIENKTGDLEYHGFTNSTGWISSILLPKRFDSNDISVEYTPYLFNASNGTDYGIVISNLDQNKVIEIELGYYGPIYNVDKNTYHYYIQNAIDNADSGNRIEVSEGIYYGNVVVNKTIELVGENRDTTIIDGGGFSNVITVSAPFTNISGFTVRNSGSGTEDSGIRFEFAGNCSIININATGNSVGIHFRFSNGNKITSNMVSDNKWGIHLYYLNASIIAANDITDNLYGLRLIDTENNNVTYNNITLNNIEGLYIVRSNFIRITNNNLSRNGKGISISDSSDYYIGNNIISSNRHGVYLSETNHCNISNNNIIANLHGIRLGKASNNNIIFNNISANNDNGISLSDSSNNNRILFNDINDNEGTGLGIGSSSYINISKNNINGNYKGITISSSWYIDIIDNNVSSYLDGITGGSSYYINISYNNISHHRANGIEFSWAQYFSIEGNTLILNRLTGIYLSSSQNNEIRNNIILESINGIHHRFSDNGNIITNNVLSSNETDIFLEYSEMNTLSGNVMEEKGILIHGTNLGDWNTHSIDTTNVVNGKPVHYWKDRNGGTIPSGAGQVILANCKNVKVMNQECENAAVGIELGFSDNNEIINNTLSNNYRDNFYIESSSYNLFSNNIIENGHRGFHLRESHNNTFLNNDISKNEWGIDLHYSENNNVMNNNISFNGFGLYAWYSSNNSIIGNDFYMNSGSLSFLSDSTGNLVYHNNMLNNNFSGDHTDNGNRWDNGFPGGGNFWSDYNGFDNLSGINQDSPGSDGLGDTPYEIDPDSLDNYPLMMRYPDINGPKIELVFPYNNSVIPSGMVLDFRVSDVNLDYVRHYIDNGEEQDLLPPFNITTSEWTEGLHEVVIKAQDYSGNYIQQSFYFTIDSIPPSLVMYSPLNNSIIPSGKIIAIDASDQNLKDLSFSVNGQESIELPYPYLINTSGWIDGSYIISVNANDSAGNEVFRWYNITIDAIHPYIVTTFPQNQSSGVEVNTTIVITFSEHMNITNTESHLSCFPFNEFELEWDLTKTILNISFRYNNLLEETTYTVSIDSRIEDMSGNSMESDFILIFTTESQPLLDSDGDGIPNIDDPDDDNDGIPDKDDEFPLDPKRGRKETQEDLLVIIVLIVIAVLFSILIIIYMWKKKGKNDSMKVEFSVIDDKRPPPPPPPRNP